MPRDRALRASDPEVRGALIALEEVEAMLRAAGEIQAAALVHIQAAVVRQGLADA